MKDQAERQRGFDGNLGVLQLPSALADAHGLPRGDRFRRQPQGDVASLDQCSVVRRPVSGVYPGFPTPFWGLSGFCVGDSMGKSLWKLVGKHAAFSKARWARSVRPRCRQLPQGPSVCDKMTPREGVDRPVLGLLSTGEPLCSPQNRRPVQAERSIYPGKTAISGTYAIWETRI